MKKPRLFCAVCAAAFTAATVSANAGLVGVLPETPGDTDWQAVNDEEPDITWVANANLDLASQFGLTLRTTTEDDTPHRRQRRSNDVGQ